MANKLLCGAFVFWSGAILVFVATVSMSVAASPGVIYVAPGADCGDVGTAIFDCFGDVQSAVNMAPPGWEIRVAAGIYTHTREYGGTIQALYISKTLTVRGGYTLTNWNSSDPFNYPTILNAQGQGRVVYITGNVSPTLQGLHITGGSGERGGGVYVNTAQATLRNNWIYGNSAQYGGGLYLVNSSAIISENVLMSNTVSYWGGGFHLFQSDALFSGNDVLANTSRYSGGGGYVQVSDAWLVGNVFAQNVTYNGNGAGLSVDGGAPRLDGNTIISNRAYYNGGGIMFYPQTNATLASNVIANNQAGSMGSGIYVSGAAPTLWHTTIANNSGGVGSGLYAVDEYVGGGWTIYSSVRLVNTIVSNQAVGVYVSLGNTVTLESTLWHENGLDWGGNGDVEHSEDVVVGDPMFVSPGRGDYHIGASSAARDTGQDAGVPTDVDGEARSDAADLGADEFQRSSCAFLPGDMCAFYGDLHSHTGYSDGVAGSTPQQAFETARANGLDFFGTSDHGFILSSEEWANTLAQAQAATQDDYFVALRGFEWTDGAGHLNVFGTENFINACDPRYNELDEGYAWLAAPAQEGVVAQFNHPGITIAVCDRRFAGGRVELWWERPVAPSQAPFDDLAYNPLADERISLLEVFNSYHNFVDEYNTALANGWHVAPTNNSDTHSANWGARRARTGIIAAGLSHDQVLDALRARHTFSTGDENLVLALQADGYWMGSRIVSGRTRFDVYAFDPGPTDAFDRLELYQNGALFSSTQVGSNRFVWSVTLPEPIAEQSWWYARAVQDDGDVAYTSPVWTAPVSCWARLNAGAIYATVQEAVDASSSPADVVKVAGHCFMPDALSEQLVYINKTLTVRGGYTVTNWSVSDPLNNPTILDAQARGRVIHVSGDVSPTIENLYITRGRADEHGTLPVGHGGGVLVQTAHALVRNNRIYDNVAEYGGGLGLLGSDAIVSGNVIESNVALLRGGGLYLDQSTARLEGNVINANSSEQSGGGLALHRRSDAVLSNNVIVANQAQATGSAVYVWGAWPTLLHNTLALNNGGDGSAVRVATGEVGSLVISSTARLTNTIFSEHQTALRVDDGNSALLAGTLWHDNQNRWSRMGHVESRDDFEGDPAFVNPGDVDYHITLASAARDVGVRAKLATDVDGEARPTVGGYDVGADEFWSPALELTHQASPDPVQDGGRLTYTISITNTGALHLQATIVDMLPQDVLADERLAGTVLLPGGRLVWNPVITAPGGVWVRQVVVTAPVQEGSLRLGSGKLLTNVVQVSTLQGVGESSTRAVWATWVRTSVYLPAIMKNYVPLKNMLPNPGFEGLGVPLNNNAPNPGNWTRDTFNGIEYGEIFTPEGWVTWWEEGVHRRPEARVIPREIPYTFDPLRIYQGYYAAMYFTMYGTHHAGYYQRVTDLKPGAALLFYARAHGWSCHGDVPLGYSCDDLENLGFYVGVDPHGGTDPWSPHVLWSERTPSPDVYRRIGPVESVVGPAGVVTVFLRSDTWWPFKHNDAYWDNAALMVDMQ